MRTMICFRTRHEGGIPFAVSLERMYPRTFIRRHRLWASLLPSIIIFPNGMIWDGFLGGWRHKSREGGKEYYRHICECIRREEKNGH